MEPRWRVRSLDIRDFRGIGALHVAADPHINLLIGPNGAGKTAVLDGMALLLGQIMASTAGVRSGMAWGLPDLRRGPRGRASQCSVALSFAGAQVNGGLVLEQGPVIAGELSAFAPGDPAESMPVFVYYKAQRAVSRYLDGAPGSADGAAPAGRLAAWEGALGRNTDFADFSRWFAAESVAEALVHSRRRTFDYRSPALEAVREAIRQMVPGCTALWYAGEDLGIRVEMEGQGEFAFIELSDGYRAVLALVADLASRMVIANPHQGLRSEAVVLVDEIDLHLHPRWQQTVLGSLRETFPHAQFWLTTHAAPVIATAAPEQIFALQAGPEGVTVHSPTSSFGALPDRVLVDIMGLPAARPPAVQRQLDDWFALIAQGEGEGEVAMGLRAALEAHFRGEDPALVRGDLERRVVAVRRAPRR